MVKQLISIPNWKAADFDTAIAFLNYVMQFTGFKFSESGSSWRHWIDEQRGQTVTPEELRADLTRCANDLAQSFGEPGRKDVRIVETVHRFISSVVCEWSHSYSLLYKLSSIAPARWLSAFSRPTPTATPRASCKAPSPIAST